jgi:TonB dependent receptor-like, beta-barrel/TonB-dependent Receptor Plug Domain
MPKSTSRAGITVPAVRATLAFMLLGGWSLARPVSAGGLQTLDEVDVVAAPDDLVGSADAATEGTVVHEQLETRPLLRPGEVLETVPGVIVTQHSGDGKANQYFLRGFNLDHGTDLATWVDGVPINLPTHGHGQGYTDLNFVIPELLANLQYRKGPYYAEEGDFSAAGAVRMHYFDSLPRDLVEASAGENDYQRGLLAASPSLGEGRLLFAIEAYHNDGPWEVPEDYRKFNGVIRYSQGGEASRLNLSAMAYHGDWDSTDQVAKRAVDNGLISRYGTLDASDGGRTHRYALTANWRGRSGAATSEATAYLVDYKLNLFSNFTYYLDDPVNGDQFEQADDRTTSGGWAKHSWLAEWGDRAIEHTVGAQVRYDDIDKVGLYHTASRQRLSTVREDAVKQLSLSPYYQAAVQWSEKVRAVLGLRADYYRFDVNSSLPQNSGKRDSFIASPKLSLIFGPWQKTEYYLDAGYGFHSNDARGTVITVDPRTLEPVSPVDPLVRAKGAEVGVRTAYFRRLQSSLALWLLDIDSELLFVGDAGTTEASRPSRRYGIEWANYYRPRSWLTVDADLALSHARFTDNDPAGNRIPGSIETTASLGVGVNRPLGWFGGARLRYFGPRPLTEDNTVRSSSSTLVNTMAGYRFTRQWQALLEVFNIFDRKVSDIDYYYTSRLPGEPAAGVDDIHTHPAEPRTARVSLRYQF